MRIKLPSGVYGQQDPRWKLKRLGNKSGSIGSFGCALVCVADMLGKTPDEVNDVFKAGGVFAKESNLISWDMIPLVSPEFNWEGRIDCDSTPAPLAEIDVYLSQGKPVIIRVEADEIGSPKSDHFVLIIGKEKDDYIIADPWTGDIVPLTSRYKGIYNSTDPSVTILGVRKIILKTGLPIESDKIQYWYEPGAENEDPNKLREARDHNWNLYQNCLVDITNIKTSNTQLDETNKEYNEQLSKLIDIIKPEKKDFANVIGRCSELVAKANNYDTNLTNLNWCNKELENSTKALGVCNARVKSLEALVGGLSVSTPHEKGGLWVALRAWVEKLRK